MIDMRVFPLRTILLCAFPIKRGNVLWISGGGRRTGDKIGGNTFVAFFAGRYHHTFLDGRMFTEMRLDFRQLNAIAANLDLMINAS